MNLNSLIRKIESYRRIDFELSVREFKQLEALKFDILTIEKLLKDASISHIALVEYYNKKAKGYQVSIERIVRRLNVWVERLMKLIFYEKLTILGKRKWNQLSIEEKNKFNRNERYFLLFAEKIRLCMSNLMRILAQNGELHQLVNEDAFVLDTKEIRSKIDEALGNDESPGLRTLIVLFKQIGDMEKRISQYSIESHIKTLLSHINKEIYDGKRSPMTDDKRTEELHRFQSILKEKQIAENRFVTKKVQILCALFSSKLRLGVPESEFPIAYVSDYLRTEAQYDGADIMGANTIGFRSIRSFENGEVIGEEISHFFRKCLRPKDEKSEVLTNEFFGFLGRKILYELLLSPAERNSFFKSPPADNVNRIQALAAISEYFRKKMKAEGIKPAPISDRRDILQHFRGYKFAERVDLRRIHDWHKLYSLPNREVRMRFFRPDPDYSGL